MIVRLDCLNRLVSFLGRQITSLVVVAKLFLAICFSIISVNNASALEFMGYDLSSEKHNDVLQILYSAAYIPSIITAESTNSNALFMGSLISASAMGFKLAQELLHKPQTAVWRQLCVNLPSVGLCIAHLVFDLARMSNVSRIVEKNKKLPKTDFTLHQSFCLAIEFFLRGCSWHAKNNSKNDNKKLISALSFAANFVEQWRLNSRWFKMYSGLPRINLNKIVTSLIDYDYMLKVVNKSLQDKQQNILDWSQEEAVSP